MTEPLAASRAPGPAGRVEVSTMRGAEQLARVTLEELVWQAEALGRLRIHPHGVLPGGVREYSVIIEFETAPGVELRARSGYGLGLYDALGAAIHEAVKIREQFK